MCVCVNVLVTHLDLFLLVYVVTYSQLCIRSFTSVPTVNYKTPFLLHFLIDLHTNMCHEGDVNPSKTTLITIRLGTSSDGRLMVMRREELLDGNRHRYANKVDTVWVSYQVQIGSFSESQRVLNGRVAAAVAGQRHVWGSAPCRLRFMVSFKGPRDKGAPCNREGSFRLFLSSSFPSSSPSSSF